jgi:tetratricopeptide (TPR) repeat protein
LGLNAVREVLDALGRSLTCEVCLDPWRPATIRALAAAERSPNDAVREKFLLSALKTLPEETRPVVFARHAEALLALGEYKRAAEQASRALASQAGLADAWTVLARVAQLRGKQKESVRLYKRALKEDPRRIDALLALSSLDPMNAAELGVKPRADLLKRAMIVRPASISVRLSLVEHYEKQANGLERALGVLREGLAITPRSLPLKLREGAVLIKQRRYNEAERSAREVVKLDSTSGKGWYNVALSLRALKQLSAAEEAVERAKQHDPPADLYFLQGLLAEDRGDTLAAMEAYRVRWSLRRQNGTDRTAEAAKTRLNRLRSR